MDPLKKMLDTLPLPQADMKQLEKRGERDMGFVAKAIREFNASACKFDNLEYAKNASATITRLQKDDFSVSVLFPGIWSRLGLSNAALSDSFFTAAQKKKLRYYGWTAKGRKMEDWHPQDGTVSESEGAAPVEDGAKSLAFLPSANLENGNCSNCKKPGKLRNCVDCAIRVDGNVIHGTFYCSKACQASHWAQHKRVCVTRKSFIRAVSLTFDIFTLFTKETFDRAVKQVEVRDGILFVQYADMMELACRGKSIYSPFPDHLVDSAHFNAVLYQDQCGQVIGTCLRLVNNLLKREFSS